MNFTHLQNTDPQILDLIKMEDQRQEQELELIASENYASKPVREAMASSFCNKYSEGYPGKRYYGGQKYVDQMEQLTIDRAKQIFGAQHVNVQPLSGSPANLAVFLGVLQPGDTILGFNLAHGGHLSHGHPLNFSGMMYNIVPYGVDQTTGLVDMEEVRKLAVEHKPKLILAGFSAYSRDFNWKEFRAVADEVGAILMGDIAHIAGLIAGEAIENPVPLCDIVTTTTHKTLRGPRGAMIMCKEQYAKAIDRAVFPGVQGWPHEHIIAAKAVAFHEALQPEFKEYTQQVIKNAQVFSQELINKGYSVISGGTDNHLILIDIFGSKGITGQQAEEALEYIGLSVNKNMIPFDTRKPMDPSGIRIGTAAATTRGLGKSEMQLIADLFDQAIMHHQDTAKLDQLKSELMDILSRFPLYK